MTTPDGESTVGETVDIEAALHEVTANDTPETAVADPSVGVVDEATAAPAEPAEDDLQWVLVSH